MTIQAQKRRPNNDPVYEDVMGEGTLTNPLIRKVATLKDSPPLLIAELGESKATTTLASPVTAGDRVLNVVSATGMAPAQNIFIVDQINGIVETFHIISIDTLAVTVDMPAGNDFITGTFVGSSNINANVNGSVTPVKFNLKTGLTDVNIKVRITRILLLMYTTAAPTLEKFGNLTALTRGIYLRKTNGAVTTYFNAKDNGDLTKLAFDLDFLTAIGAGQDGLKMRLTFEKMGGIIELAQDEDLELWVQDDLTGLTRLSIVVEGYFVT